MVEEHTFILNRSCQINFAAGEKFLKRIVDGIKVLFMIQASANSLELIPILEQQTKVGFNAQTKILIAFFGSVHQAPESKTSIAFGLRDNLDFSSPSQGQKKRPQRWIIFRLIKTHQEIERALGFDATFFQTRKFCR